jgi:hypothetical protein
VASTPGEGSTFTIYLNVWKEKDDTLRLPNLPKSS